MSVSRHTLELDILYFFCTLKLHWQSSPYYKPGFVLSVYIFSPVEPFPYLVGNSF